MAKRKTAKSSSSLRFIVSNDKSPQVALKPGMRLNVVSTVLVGPDMRRIRNIGARLCGGSGTCMALVDLGSEVINPARGAAKGRRRRG